MTAPKEIRELVERFENNLEEYRSGRYNETELRRDFVDPFFKALGWDVGNKGGRSELYREVVHEDSVKVRGSTKAPDYGFYVGGARKFFVEAKKPSVNLENDVKAAFQLRSYAWSAGLSISLLTDFEEFSIYDCRIEPANSDSPKVALLRHFTYDKYIDHWDQIAALFSREAVLGGSLERFIESRKRKKGTIAVDEAFLREIDHWREILAKNVHKNNLNLTVRELNSSVQNSIDRIVFLRICEDRGIERDERLKDLLKGEKAIYTMLVEQFRQADEKYNSGLFHFKKDNSRHGEPDELALGLKIDDEVLSEIIENLYPPKSPYRFSVIPAEILGHVYEQFLGKVISLGDDGDVEVEYKPEVRKAGGVYYTPTYIVDYIVENTVGKLLEGATPTTAADLRILDPACGSGSFLIGAYQRLLDWHLEWYADHLVPLLEAKKPETSKEVRALLPESYVAGNTRNAGNNKKRGRGRPRKSNSANSASTAGQFPIFQAGGGEWRLTTAERKRILLNNIHGVDIDLAAVEVTKLSLQLKVLEGENVETLSKQLTLFHERALPDLGENVKCGNSLIGPDFYDRQTSLFDEEEMYRVNAFDWGAEFPEIMGRGGFDAVIGNPPYIRIQTMKEWAPVEVEFYKRHYDAAKKGNYDIYVVFVERGLSLLNTGGILGFILPHKFFQAQFGGPIRQLLSNKKAISQIVHFGAEQIFSNATTYTCLLFLSSIEQRKLRYVSIKKFDNPSQVLYAINKFKPHPDYQEADLSQPDSSGEWHFSADNSGLVLSKLKQQSLTLSDITRKIFVGLQTSADSVYVMKFINSRGKYARCYSTAIGEEVEIELDFIKPFLKGKDVHRYQPPNQEYIVIFPYIISNDKALLMSEDYIKDNYPSGWNYLLKNRDFLSKRERGKFSEKWWAYGRTQNLTEFETTKIMTPEIALGCQMSYDQNGTMYHTTKIYSFVFDDRNKESALYFLGILNSKLLWLFLKSTGYTLRGGYFTFKTEYLNPFSIRTIDFSDPEDVARHDSMVGLVERMLDLHKRLAETKTGHEKTLLSRQIEATDRQIDRLVYELYGLSEEEVAIVEDAAR